MSTYTTYVTAQYTETAEVRIRANSMQEATEIIRKALKDESVLALPAADDRIDIISIGDIEWESDFVRVMEEEK